MNIQYIQIDDKKLALVDIKSSADLLAYLEDLEDSLEALRRMGKRHKSFPHSRVKIEFLENRILALRLSAGITQKELASRLKTSQAYVSKIESPTHRPSLATLQKIAKVLKIRVEDLI